MIDTVGWAIPGPLNNSSTIKQKIGVLDTKTAS